MIGPVLVFSALGITATVTSHDAMQGMMKIGILNDTVKMMSKLVPYLLVRLILYIYICIYSKYSCSIKICNNWWSD